MRHVYKNLLVLVLANIVLMYGCSKSDSESSDETETQEGVSAVYNPENDPLVNPESIFKKRLKGAISDETIYINLKASPNTLCPLFSSTHYDHIVIDQIFEKTYTNNRELNWMFSENAVFSFNESEDHTEYIVKLRKGVTWHDGTPVTAHDIVFTYDAVLDEKVPIVAFRDEVKKFTACVAIDDYTVKYTSTGKLVTTKVSLEDFPIIPKHLYEKHREAFPDLKTGKYYNTLARHPVGNGPYKIIEWIENDKIILERYEDFIGEKPFFKRVVFKIIQDMTVALLTFEKGELDVFEAIKPKQFAKETNSESFKKVGYKLYGKEWTYDYIGWNQDGSNPFFADKRVRFAMTHALDIDLVFDQVYYNLGTRCYGTYHPDAWMFNKNIQLLEYDLEKSKQLLNEAMWLVDENDGWRYKIIDGKKIKFVFEIMIPQGSATGPQIAAIFQKSLKKIGIELKTRTFEWATFVGKMLKHEYMAQMSAWVTGTDPDSGWNIWRTEQYKDGRNTGGYTNARVDALFLQGRHEFDKGKRAKIYQEIQKQLYDDQPYLWLKNRVNISVVNKRISGITFSPTGILGFYPSQREWWIDALVQ